MLPPFDKILSGDSITIISTLAEIEIIHCYNIPESILYSDFYISYYMTQTFIRIKL